MNNFESNDSKMKVYLNLLKGSFNSLKSRISNMNLINNSRFNLKDKIEKLKNSKKMRRSLKISGFVLAVLLVIPFYDINPHKEIIEKFVSNQTGKTVILNGPIRFRLIPTLMFEAKDVVIKNNKDSKTNLVEAARIRVSPGIFGFMFGQKIIKCKISELKYKNILIPYLKSKIHVKKELVELRDTRIQLKKGKEEGMFIVDLLQIDMSEEQPKYFLKHQDDDFPIHLVFALMESKTKIYGNTAVDIELSAQGLLIPHIKKSLKGTVSIEVSKGKLHGIDLIASLREAKSLFETMTSKLSHTLAQGFDALVHRHRKTPTGITPFDSLKIQAKIENGFIRTESMHIQQKHFLVKGNGNINLHKNTLDFLVEALYREQGSVRNARALAPLILKVTGPFQDPNIKPDFESYMHYLQQGDGVSKNEKLEKKKGFLNSINPITPVKKWLKI